MYFNKQCLIKNITPRYATIKIPNLPSAVHFTKPESQKLRIRNELRFLYIKNISGGEVVIIKHKISA
jgi:hypothetical protein